MSPIRLPTDHCPTCRKPLNAHKNPYDPQTRPEPGDFSVCAWCGAIHVYDLELRLRPMELQDWMNASERERERVMRMQAFLKRDAWGGIIVFPPPKQLPRMP